MTTWLLDYYFSSFQIICFPCTFSAKNTIGLLCLGQRYGLRSAPSFWDRVRAQIIETSVKLTLKVDLHGKHWNLKSCPNSSIWWKKYVLFSLYIENWKRNEFLIVFLTSKIHLNDIIYHFYRCKNFDRALTGWGLRGVSHPAAGHIYKIFPIERRTSFSFLKQYSKYIEYLLTLTVYTRFAED